MRFYRRGGGACRLRSIEETKSKSNIIRSGGNATTIATRGRRAVLTIAVLLGACSPVESSPVPPAPADRPAESGTSSSGAPEPAERSGEAPQAVEVDRGLLAVTLVLPSDLIEFVGQGGTPESAITKIGITEFESLVSNPDGSVTIKMSRLEHNRLVAKLESELRDFADELGSSGEGITKVTYNRSFTEFDVTIDRSVADESATFWILVGLSLQWSLYALIAGEGTEAGPPVIRFIDAATGQVFETSEDMRS